jgi:hypothetical protein
MEFFWWLYLATRLDEIRLIFGAGVATSVLSLFFVGVFCLLFSSEFGAERCYSFFKTVCKFIIPLCIFCVIGKALTPSKNDAMFIAGGVGVIEGAKAIQGSEIAKKSVAVIEQWLGNNLEELKQKGNNLKKDIK